MPAVKSPKNSAPYVGSMAKESDLKYGGIRVKMRTSEGTLYDGENVRCGYM